MHRGIMAKLPLGSGALRRDYGGADPSKLGIAWLGSGRRPQASNLACSGRDFARLVLQMTPALYTLLRTVPEIGLFMLRAYRRILLLLAMSTIPVQGLAAVIGPCCAGFAGSDMLQDSPAGAHDHHHPAPSTDVGDAGCECAACVGGSLSVPRESSVDRVSTNTRKLPVVYRSAIADHVPGMPLRPPSL
ncbi:MAG: hypothetical protein OEN20_08405 [Gammaproteobacteria bacterium]|nr:hypothetical protein [Gammaproteobacteria bacterium]